MGKYSNITKVPGESQIGGVKYNILFAPLSVLSACPALVDVKESDDDYKNLVGDFVFEPDTEKFNKLECVSNTGELKWESAGSKGRLKMKLMASLFINTMSAAFYRYVHEGSNDDMVYILERADCSGVRFVFGGCCLPAQITKISGGLGKEATDDPGTTIELEAYSQGLPPVLPIDTVLPVN